MGWRESWCLKPYDYIILTSWAIPRMQKQFFFGRNTCLQNKMLEVESAVITTFDV